MCYARRVSFQAIFISLAIGASLGSEVSVNDGNHRDASDFVKDLCRVYLQGQRDFESVTDVKNSDLDLNQTLHAGLQALCPVLAHSVFNETQNDTTATPPTGKAQISDFERYGMSSIAVLIISLTSLMVVLVLPCLGKKIYEYLMMGMIGLAFGTMSGDAILHLIPQGLGLHSHDGPDDHHYHGEYSEEHLSKASIPDYLWKQLGVLAAVYGIFILEILMESFSGGHQDDNHGHGHSHIVERPESMFNGKTNSVVEKAPKNVELVYSSQTALTIQDDVDATHAHNEPVFKTPIICWGMRSMAWVIVFGDAIHNIGDGLAIGAAFSDNPRSGISTSIAVLCHELPHEFGDFVVLLSTGMSFKKALFANFCCAMCCFAGLYIGLTVGNDESARSWILIATAGIFLYVSLTEMLPELKKNANSNPMAMFLVKNFGILSGIAGMVVIAIFEDKIVL